MSLVWSLERVIQVVMDGLFHPFHFVGKKSNPEQARKNCKVLRILYTYLQSPVINVLATETTFLQKQKYA